MKAIEILEDFVEAFYFSNVNKKFKNKTFLLGMINKLCYYYTAMALLLLKLNDVQSAEMLLGKTNALLNERRNNIASDFEKQLSMDKEFERNEMELNERHDTKELIYKHDLVEFFKEQLVSNSVMFEDNDNSTFIDAKFNYNFVAALLE